jgi:hypothetical protein
MRSGDSEIEKLAGIAVEAKTNFVEAALAVGNSAEFFQRETDRYMAQAGADWSDDGLAEHMRARWSEANRAWAADVAAITGDTVERPAPRIEVEAPPASAVREAGEAMQRADERDEEAGPSHMAILFQAVLARREPFVERLEHELAEALASGATDLNEHIAPLLRGPLRDLFRADIEAVIAEAKDGG